MYGNTNLFFGLGFDRMNIRLMDETNEMKKKTKLFLNGGLIILSAGFYRFRIDLLCVCVYVWWQQSNDELKKNNFF